VLRRFIRVKAALVCMTHCPAAELLVLTPLNPPISSTLPGCSLTFRRQSCPVAAGTRKAVCRFLVDQQALCPSAPDGSCLLTVSNGGGWGGWTDMKRQAEVLHGQGEVYCSGGGGCWLPLSVSSLCCCLCLPSVLPRPDQQT